MTSFIELFQFLTGSKLTDLDKIVKEHREGQQSSELGEVINVYLTLNGFRRACLVYPKKNINIREFEKRFQAKVYKIESKKKGIKVYLITTSKSKRIKQLAEDYQKYIYDEVVYEPVKIASTQRDMGRVLEYIHTSLRKQELSGTLSYAIFYKDMQIRNDIYVQGLRFGDLTPKELDTIKSKSLLLHNILKQVSNNFNVSIRLRL